MVADSATTKPIDYLLVAVFQYNTDKIVSYSYTDAFGRYKIILPYSSGLFTLKSKSLEYQEYKRDIVVSEANNKEIEVSFFVSQKVNTLNEVMIKARTSPIIVKKDTIIYDIKQYTQTGDQTLEDVLRKIPGFDVAENGDLKINGRPISKVLINGEEFLKGGAALSTRSISPEMIENIEVRLDEKNTKLKESLLNSDKLIVLDIKLKDDLDKTLFGKTRLTSGYQKRLNFGGYANLFSLSKKQKHHLLGEYDALGHQTISITEIANIGREAFQAILSLPADFNSLTENPEFNKEIYGFKDYTVSKSGIGGLTSKFNLSKDLELFIGTYNSHNDLGIATNTTQFFFEPLSNFTFTEAKSNLDYNSKNKIDLQFNKEKVKINYNLNLVFANKTFEGKNQFSENDDLFQSTRKNLSEEYYQNLTTEYVFSKKIVFHSRTFFGLSTRKIAFNLMHNKSDYISYFYDDENNLVLNFIQETRHERKELATDNKFQITNKLGSFQMGYQFLSENRSIEKHAFKNSDIEKEELSNSVFGGSTPILTYIKSMPYLSHRISSGKTTFNNKLGVANLKFPNLNYVYNKINLIEFSSNLDIVINTEDNLSLSYSQKVSPYNTLNIAQGYDIIDFQTIAVPQQSESIPRLERSIQAYFSKIINPLNTAVEAFTLYGTSNTYNSFGFDKKPFIDIIYDQLGGNYFIGGLKLAAVFNNFPISLKLEPNYFRNKNDNLAQGLLYATKTERKMLQLRALSQFKNENFNFELKTKVSDFSFGSDLSEPTSQRIISVGVITKSSLFQKKLYVQASGQRIQFRGGNSALNYNVSGRLHYAGSRYLLFIEGDNLLNNQYFIKQSILPTYFSDSLQNLFGRYLKVGFEYNFK